jgi:hypothetical protein
MADIFISYSQKDRALAKSLADFLVECGYDLWWDYDLIGGTKFRAEIKRKLESSKAAIVIWTPNSVESDWVVEEAEEAKHTKKLIATRVADLDYRAIPLGFRGVHTELVTEPERILKALESIGVGPSRPPAAPKRGPVFIDKRLDADAIAKAEQFAHWEFIKDSKDPSAFSGFIEQFPTSSFVTLARIQLGKLAAEAWEALRDSENLDALTRFAGNFPLDPRAAEATERIRTVRARVEEAASWDRIKDSSTIADVEAHLALYPDGSNAVAARAKLASLRREREIAERWNTIAEASEAKDFEDFLAEYPDSAFRRRGPSAAHQNPSRTRGSRLAGGARGPTAGARASLPQATSRRRPRQRGSTPVGIAAESDRRPSLGCRRQCQSSGPVSWLSGRLPTRDTCECRAGAAQAAHGPRSSDQPGGLGNRAAGAPRCRKGRTAQATRCQSVATGCNP